MYKVHYGLMWMNKHIERNKILWEKLTYDKGNEIRYVNMVPNFLQLIEFEGEGPSIPNFKPLRGKEEETLLQYLREFPQSHEF